MTPGRDPFDELAFLRGEVIRLRRALDTLTPRIEDLLRRRGFRVYKKEPAEDLLIPSPEYLDSFYGMMHRYSFRLFLRDIIKHQPLFTPEQVARYATREVTEIGRAHV